VAGAAALLAASPPPDHPTTPYTPTEISDILKTERNAIWDDDSDDGIHEPLLDVRDSVFNPDTLPGPDSGVPVNTPPQVTITSPTTAGTYTWNVPISFEGTVTDNSDVGLEELLTWTWASSPDNGPLNNGEAASSFVDTLLDGSYSITASVTDSDGAPGSASVNITVGAPPPPPELIVSGMDYSTAGGRGGDKHVSVTVSVDPVTFGVSVTIEMKHVGSSATISGTGTTDEFGEVTFTWKNAPDGCYVTTVTDLNGTNMPGTPDNEFPKNVDPVTCG